MKQLANKSMAISLDAINNLEQIARQDAQKHWKIIKVLGNFVLNNARYLPNEELQKNPRVKITQDIQAALRGIGRRRVILSAANFSGANLE